MSLRIRDIQALVFHHSMLLGIYVPQIVQLLSIRMVQNLVSIMTGVSIKMLQICFAQICTMIVVIVTQAYLHGLHYHNIREYVSFQWGNISGVCHWVVLLKQTPPSSPVINTLFILHKELLWLFSILTTWITKSVAQINSW